MSFERYLEDLDDLLDFRARARWTRDVGEPVPEMPGELADRYEDLASAEGVATLVAATDDAPAGHRLARLRAAAATLVVEHRSADAAVEIDEAFASLTWPDARRTAWPDMTWRLTTLARPADRDALAGALEDASGTAARLYEELAGARCAAVPDPLGRGSPVETARGRSVAEVRSLAVDLLARTEDLLGPALRGVLAELGGRPDRPPVDLPRVRAGAALATRMPRADGALVRYVLERLGLGAAAEGRLALRLPEGKEPLPRAGVHVLEPGRDVRLVAARSGPPADYRSLLGGLGEGLTAALVEDREGIDGRLVDPAVGRLHGALFEQLATDQVWIESATRLPPEASWIATGTAHRWLRLRELAAVVASADRWPLVDAPAVVDPEALESATGFRHPAGTAPWAPGVVGAADELVARLAAPALVDRLASRWGSEWFASGVAGSLLRDLWAAPHETLGELMLDLRLGELSLQPLMEQTLRGPSV